MRIGCLFSSANNIQYLHKSQSPYSVNMLAALAARAAIQDTAYVTRYVTEILAARELVYVGLEKLKIPYFESQGNFVLMQLGTRAGEVRDALRQRGILVRDRGHEIAGTVRVTVGTRDQMREFLNALEQIWA
jgi:histidinol-phosphate aminotransferase